MLDGGFAAHPTGRSDTFSTIPVDQTVEETVNRDTQAAGGSTSSMILL